MGRATDGSSAELEVGTLGWLLFRLIFFQNDAQLCHGQVTSNANGQHSLTNQPGVLEVSYQAVTEVNTEPEPQETSRDFLAALLGRLLRVPRPSVS
ncbi:hypothetical protein F442_01648, partial [Phytophthora nicotianae P10297]